MADEPKKIIVDDDWKAEARREKERLAREAARPEAAPAPQFAEVLNIIAMQAMAALGLLGGPEGQRMPPNLEAAKHFIDLLQVLDDKTKNNLNPEERTLLEQVLYEMRMTFVQFAGAATGMPPGGPGVAPPTGRPPA
jgi:hypothetical protein